MLWSGLFTHRAQRIASSVIMNLYLAPAACGWLNLSRSGCGHVWLRWLKTDDHESPICCQVRKLAFGVPGFLTVATADRDLKECHPHMSEEHFLCFQAVRGGEHSGWNIETIFREKRSHDIYLTRNAFEPQTGDSSPAVAHW